MDNAQILYVGVKHTANAGTTPQNRSIRHHQSPRTPNANNVNHVTEVVETNTSQTTAKTKQPSSRITVVFDSLS